MSTPGTEDYRHLEALIELLRADLRGAVGEIKTALASRVDIAVYQADQRRVEQQIESVRLEAAREVAAEQALRTREVAAEQALRAREIAALGEELEEVKKQRADDKTQRVEEHKERRADRRVVIGACIGAALSFLATLAMLLVQLFIG
ncbi:hypothetical protein [Nocardiopsis synnemataformans]|uniref:hypothetical protein n=1 Tax=Nocardiopsis synnemataformans TaxID=61305 RepID=UPI003EBAF66F